MAARAHARAAFGYVVLLGTTGALALTALVVGSDRTPIPDIGGTFAVAAPEPCLGARFVLEQSGSFVSLGAGDPDASTPSGSLRFDGESLVGDVTCIVGQVEPVEAAVTTGADGPVLQGAIAGADFQASRSATAPSTLADDEKHFGHEELLGRLMLAIAVVVGAARLGGLLIGRLGQPRVMGEVIAGILLGPTLFGALAPEVQAFLFPAEVQTLLGGVADVGLVFYMFLVGLELDPAVLRGRVEEAAFISHASIAIPMASGLLVAVPLFRVLGPDTDFAPFAVFMGVAMSITAFPVLARILLERRMLKSDVGSLAIGAAAVDDVTAWMLLALATGVAGATAGAGDAVGLEVARVVVLTAVFVAIMAFPVRRLLARVSTAYDEAGHIPTTWLAAIFVGVLISAYAATAIPVAGIFGAFVMGLAMPRRADLDHEVRGRIEDFVVMLLLPLFFVVTGLRVEVGLLDDPQLWLITLALLGVAVFGKWVGASGAARYAGLDGRSATAIGALMNTRGLTELIVLNLGLALGVITPVLFTMLVIMALVTTFMTGPALRLIDPKGELSTPLEDEVPAPARAPAAIPDRMILVAPQDPKHAHTLARIGAALAASEPRRELLLVRVLEPSRAAAALARDEQELETASHQLRDIARELEVPDIRTTAFTSPDIGGDIVRLATEQPVDMVIVDGRRPLLRPGPPGGSVGHVLERSPSDVAVYVGREAALDVSAAHLVAETFGGGDHDWAAVEFGAWIAAWSDSPLLLIGSKGDDERDASRLLSSVSLVVQRLTGVDVGSRIVAPGREGVLEGTRDAGLLVVGLSDRWRTEGLGDVRAAIARDAPAPTVFVRRGSRPGTLASRDDVTRFTWSRTRPGRSGSATDATFPTDEDAR